MICEVFRKMGKVNLIGKGLNCLVFEESCNEKVVNSKGGKGCVVFICYIGFS